MPSTIRSISNRYTWAAGGFFLLAAFLIFKHLDYCLLWQDEAQTALLAKSILKYGLPRGYDGLNYFSQGWGIEYGPNYIWRCHPWIPFYVLALGFKLFGVSTTVARWPFAMFGLATIALSFFFCWRWKKDLRMAAATVLLLATSVPFLILSRQCRYYAPLLFFVLWAFWAYRGFLDDRSRSRGWLGTSLVLIFHTAFFYYAITAATFLLHIFLFHRSRLRPFLRLFGITVLINLPGLWWFSGLTYGPAFTTGLAHPRLGLQFLAQYIGQLHAHVFPLYVLPLTLWMVWRKRQTDPTAYRVDSELLSLIGVFTGLSIALNVLIAPGYYFRYIFPVIPPLIAGLAYTVSELTTWNRAAGTVLVLALISLQPLQRHAYELTHAFTGPMEGLVSYLNAQAKPGDVVGITYEDMPLKFYTPLRVVGGLTGEDLKPLESARFIVVRKHTISTMDATVKHYITTHLKREKYTAVPLPGPDTLYENRESPEGHLFQTVQNEVPVVVHVRK